MTLLGLISELQGKGVRLYVSGGRLRVNAPRGVLTPELEARLSAHRDGIIDFLSRAVGDGSAGSLPPAPESPEHPLSHQQRQLWLLDQLDEARPVYNVPLVLRLRGRLDREALVAALKSVVARHSVLRTTYAQREAEPVQRISHDVSPELLTLDATPEGALEASREFGRRRFDLTRDLPLRASLARLRDEDHLFTLVFHHIACDGWSVQVVMRDLFEAYSAFAAGLRPPDERPAQYVDYVHWQLSPASRERVADDLTVWRRRLEGSPGLLELPLDRPRPVRQEHRGTSVPFAFDEALTHSLRGLAAREGCTLFMVLLAAYQLLLSRYAGQRDVTVGSPTANRGSRALEDAVGFFANSVPLRVRVEPERPFVELLRQVRDVTLDAYARQATPFERIVEAVAPERSLSNMPLFQAEFVFQNTPTPRIELSHLSAEVVELESEVAKFDLSLAMLERGETLRGRFEYDGDLFERATVERMSENYRTLCAAAADAPETPASRLPLLAPAQRAALLDVWNRPEEPDAGAGCVHDLFAAQARRAPDAVALVFGEQSLTYSALRARARGLAARLRAHGVSADVPVGLCLRRSTLPFIALLGILEAGGAYVPLDPGYPRERLSLMIEQAAPPVIVTEEALLPLFDEVAADLIVLDGRGGCATARGEAAPEGDRAVAARPDSLAYVLFTSGSTGRPKGVMLEHGTLFNMVTWYANSFQHAPGDRTLQFASISFDVSFEEAFTCWNTGGALMVLDEEERLSPRRVLERLVRWGVDRVIIPVVLLQALAQEFDSTPGARAPSLRQIITSGSQLQLSDEIRRFCRAMPGCVLHNNYGPAETHAVTREPMAATPDDWPALPAIGRPIANTRCYVVDEAGGLLPPGVKGELLIGGVAVGRGYYRQPGLTAERFTPDPWDARGGGRLYGTRDLVRLCDDGRLTWLGRMDDMVKVRGVRIELGEIEAALRAHPAAGEVAARVWEDGPGGEQLAAYVQPRSGDAPPPENELRAFLRERLPGHMLPARVVTVARMPLGPNGKIDRKALPRPEPASEAGPRARTETERAVAAVWAEVLGLAAEQIGVHDNFFSLGGHSLLAGRMTARLRDLTGVALPLRVAFERPTVAEVAEWLDVQMLLGRVRCAEDSGASGEGSPPEEVVI